MFDDEPAAGTIHTLAAPAATPIGAGIAAETGMGEPLDQPGGVSFTDRYVTRDGSPWLPVMGEYHFSRDDASHWETELLKLKAGGVTVVATYLLWIVHEERRGELRWDGNRDLARFLGLARDVGLAVMLRIGPWAHGETRNGGFPDWLQSLDIAHRTNDPEYQSAVRGWYTAVAEQARDFFRTPGSPDNAIIGVQVDNELYDQPDHLAWLRQTAEASGIVAPLWTATGWGGSQLPDDLMPIFAGYSDGFWEESDIVWPSFGRTHFEFSTVRDDLTVGADLRTSAAVARQQDERYPWVTCELAGGMAIAYHRRPLVESHDVAALALVKLGSGSAWQGYYMYHGGTHVVGDESTTQETHATGYPNDMPRLDYDFYAPVGSHGQLREHYHLLRQQHLFVEQYGPALLESTSAIAETADGAPRWAFRGDGTGGHLFVNNRQPAAETLPAIDDVRFSVTLDDGEVTLPTEPITLDSGAYFVWPVRRPFGSLPSVSATAQPITELATDDGTVVLVAAVGGVPVEFVFDGVSPDEITGGSIRTTDDARTVVRIDDAPGVDTVITVRDTTFVVLDPLSASRVWAGDIAGRRSLVIADDGVLFDRGGLTLVATRPEQTVYVYPPLAAPSAAARAVDGPSALFAAYVVDGPAATSAPVVSTVVEAAGVAPRRTGGSSGRYSAPLDGDYAAAGEIEIEIPAAAFETAGDRVLLSVDWTGDVARASVGDATVSDQFWYGREWDIPLAHGADRVVTITALPFDPQSPVFVDPRVRPAADAPVLEVRAARVIRSRTIALTDPAPRKS